MATELEKGERVGQYAAKPQQEIAQPLPVEESLPSASSDLEIGIDFVPKARSVWNERRLVFRIVAASLLASTLLAFLLPKRYDSTTKLMPPDNQSTSGMAMIAALASKGNVSPGLSGVAGDLLGVKSSGALFIGILSSQTVQDRLIERFDLRHVYGLKYWQDARKRLAENTSLDEERKSGIITVAVRDRDPKRAAAMAAAYVEELNKLVAQLSTSSAHKERVFLEERLVAVKQDLDQASRDFSQFSSKNKTLDIKEEAKAMLQGAATLEGELIALESQLRGLQAIYTDNNVRVRSVQARIAELHRQLDNIGGAAPSAGANISGANALGATIPGATTPGAFAPGRVPGEVASGATSGGIPAAGRATSADSSQSQFPSIRNLPLLGVTYADLYRRVQIQETVFEVLTQQYELAKVQEAKEIPSVKVLDPANIPERKSFPPRILIIALGGFLGFVGACVFIFGREHWAAIDDAEPGKVLVTEVLHAMHSQMPWAPPNGSRWQAQANRVWVKLVSKNGSNGDATHEANADGTNASDRDARSGSNGDGKHGSNGDGPNGSNGD